MLLNGNFIANKCAAALAAAQCFSGAPVASGSDAVSAALPSGVLPTAAALLASAAASASSAATAPALKPPRAVFGAAVDEMTDSCR